MIIRKSKRAKYLVETMFLLKVNGYIFIGKLFFLSKNNDAIIVMYKDIQSAKIFLLPLKYEIILLPNAIAIFDFSLLLPI